MLDPDWHFDTGPNAGGQLKRDRVDSRVVGVSYTHLDVYKRQVEGLVEARSFGICEAGIEAVRLSGFFMSRLRVRSALRELLKGAAGRVEAYSFGIFQEGVEAVRLSGLVMSKLWVRSALGELLRGAVGRVEARSFGISGPGVGCARLSGLVMNKLWVRSAREAAWGGKPPSSRLSGSLSAIIGNWVIF